MKTPQDVGRFRIGIIKKMMKGDLPPEQAINIQKMTDRELLHLIRSNQETN